MHPLSMLPLCLAIQARRQAGVQGIERAQRWERPLKVRLIKKLKVVAEMVAIVVVFEFMTGFNELIYVQLSLE